MKNPKTESVNSEVSYNVRTLTYSDGFTVNTVLVLVFSYLVFIVRIEPLWMYRMLIMPIKVMYCIVLLTLCFGIYKLSMDFW